MFTTKKAYEPYVSPFDPCKPIRVKTYSTPPHLYIGFQQPNLPQFTPSEALRAGTLWKAFYDPYYSPYERAREGSST
ncbi:spore coat associated protein CotJA [Cytobacillus depressus]|uniref:Spore coat associated protein CotJA n=1 Tax=Cytobacillus depressus TaxID=1602942 RepID=A0A6L3V9J0_9BACI|nr:spore coat associated protein CotJA [Cytobacillus depressus]KAB2338351.1 spore coat associated protein CotJA [Cytobacillus depressus]